jgi:F0F1-type ATP synthase delta subunit
MVKDARIISRLEHTTFVIEGKEITLQNVSLARDHKTEIIRCELLLHKTLTNREIRKLKAKIEERLDKTVILEALIRMQF